MRRRRRRQYVAPQKAPQVLDVCIYCGKPILVGEGAPNANGEWRHTVCFQERFLNKPQDEEQGHGGS